MSADHYNDGEVHSYLLKIPSYAIYDGYHGGIRCRNMVRSYAHNRTILFVQQLILPGGIAFINKRQSV